MTCAEIIDRLKAGETGREIDCEIAPFGGWNFDPDKAEHQHCWYRVNESGGRDWYDRTFIPHYTTSIDAAVSLWPLVDEVVEVKIYPEGETTVSSSSMWSVEGPTEAVARTIAALSALEAMDDP